jgi:hypothetical protein
MRKKCPKKRQKSSFHNLKNELKNREKIAKLEFRHQKKGLNRVVGIDPGINGAVVFYDGSRFEFNKMPLMEKNLICFLQLQGIFERYNVGETHFFLEKPSSYCQGHKAAFNYGRNFSAVEIALNLADATPHLVEPSKWTALLHRGFPKDLKTKIKSEKSLEYFAPEALKKIDVNRAGRRHDGLIDAALIALYGFYILTKESYE